MASASPASTSTAAASSDDTARTQAEARQAVLGTLEAAGSTYSSRLQARAADVHANAAVLEKQERETKANAVQLAQETDKWQKELDRATKGLNQFGDLQNWAEYMERDFLVLEETLRLVEGREAVDSASGGSQWTGSRGRDERNPDA